MDFMISLFGSETTGQPRAKPRMRLSVTETDVRASNGWSSIKRKSNLNILNDRLRSHSSGDLPELECHARICQDLPPEDEEGNIEYKLKLIDPSPSRFEHLVTQLKWRLREGQGEAIYEIGVEDSGMLAGLTVSEMDASLSTLQRMADRLSATMTLLREREIIGDDAREVRHVAEVLIRKVPDSQQFIDLRVAVLGCADAGKSTLLGVITQGETDNGRGRARLNLFRHLHEIQTGRTSSISLDLVGFDANGKIITRQNHSVEEILENSTKLVTFIDLAGHQKYLKTTIFGLTGYKPHFVLLVIAANMGVVGTTREHLGIAMALEVPIFVVVTKIDLVSCSTISRLLQQLEQLIKGPGCKRIPVRVENQDDAISVAANFNAEQVVPLFTLSSVTGENIELLCGFLNMLPATDSLHDAQHHMQEPPVFNIDDVFQLNHAGAVVAGLLAKGIVREGDSLLVGPSSTGEFYPVRVESVHRNKAPSRLVHAGHAASLALGEFRDCILRRGMVLVDPIISPRATLSFEAKVYILYHPTQKICQGFQTTVHIGNVCQTAIMTKIDKPSLKTNEEAVVIFKFIKQPEFVCVGSRLLFREGRTKGIGQVTNIFCDP